ncbi:hypothetical protein J2W56_006720 [Nocardia kruczakiae]|uniref:Uncharacterized protein n=1 Tax=Nocardia kruczakiae TaxID=261477 RepID=A0ABU1XRE5_9NOCA|nr:hypothetical protein [Nocardia kruczakiae]MDR7172954.1 hypothetical protein [Nocardia kruczakiae]
MSDYDAENIANTAAAREAGWPDLTGAPKQIPWANTVRANKIRELEASNLPEADKTVWREAMLRETRASEWIDYRNQPWAAPALVNFTDDEHKRILGL